MKNEPYIKRLIAEGEHQQQDFKFEIADSKKIARSLVAFSNTDGGRLLIGVKDNGKIAGVRSEEEFFMVEAAARLYSRPEISFQSREWTIDGRTVLEIIIPKSEQRPHYALNEKDKWLVYIRVKDQNLLANKVLLRVWKREKQTRGITIQYTDAEKTLLSYLGEKPTISLSAFSRIAGISRNKAETILVNFISIRLISIVFTDKGVYYCLPEKKDEKRKGNN